MTPCTVCGAPPAVDDRHALCRSCTSTVCSRCSVNPSEDEAHAADCYGCAIDELSAKSLPELHALEAQSRVAPSKRGIVAWFWFRHRLCQEGERQVMQRAA